MVNPKDKEEDKGKINSVPTSVVKRVASVDNNNVDSRVRRHRRSEWRRRWRPYGGRRFSRSFGKNSRLDDLESRKAKWLNLRMHVLGQPLAPYNTTQFLMDDHHVREPEFGQIDRLLQVNASTTNVTSVSSPSNTTTSVLSPNNNNNNNNNSNSLNKNNNNIISLNNNNAYNRENSSNSFEGNFSSTNETKSPNSNGATTGTGGGQGYRRRCMSDSTPSRKNSEDASSDDFYSSPDDEQDFIQRQFFETYENIHAERISTMSKAELVKEYLLLEQRCEELETKLKEMEYSVGLKT